MKFKICLGSALFLIAGLLGGAFVYNVHPQKNGADLKQVRILASLSGFEPGAAVTYKLLSQDQAPLLGSAQTDEHGNLDIPLPQEERAAPAPRLTYDFSVKERQRTLAVLMNLDTKTGRLSLQGRGLGAFDKVKMGAPDDSLETRCDWSGGFEEKNIKTTALGTQNAPFQVAFYQLDRVNDAASSINPAMIKIVYAPGGGGPESSGTNQYQPQSFCPLSICDTQAMDQQIDNIIKNLVHPLMHMTEQLAAVAMQQTQITGTFLDAKAQMEALQEMQELKAEAIKDYHPSDQMCRFGSFTRSLATADSKARYNQLALGDLLMKSYKNTKGVSTAMDSHGDVENRLRQYRETYCDPSDNNNGLGELCKHKDGIGAKDRSRVNKDSDFSLAIENAYTLDVDFSDGKSSAGEDDVIALAKNLYWPEPFKIIPQESLEDDKYNYMAARRIMALQGVAHNSFAAIVGMKAKTPEGASQNGKPGWAYMKTMMREFGMKDDDIEQMIGKNPSYYAQMDILTKKIYQNPDFYTNLYDKPANVERTRTAMEALKLMQLRDHYEASLRREMLLSGLLEETLVSKAKKIQGEADDMKSP